MFSRSSSREVRHFALSGLCAAIAAVTGAPAWAACVQTGMDVECVDSDPAQPNFDSGADAMSVRVNMGVQMGANASGTASPINLRGSGTSLTNYGTIDPQTNGPIQAGAGVSGVSMISETASTKAIRNYAGSSISGAFTSATSPSTAAIIVHNQRSGNDGRTTIYNGGTISAKPRGGITGIPNENVIAIAAPGSAQVLMNNDGTVTGRIGFGSSAPGNTLTNAGTITGSVALGNGGGNRFIAKTGSSVLRGAGTAPGYITFLGTSSARLDFAPAGIVDGGEAGGNTLELSAGVSPTGAMAIQNYVNFNTLIIDSGVWTITGGSSSSHTTLRGTAVIENSLSLGMPATTLLAAGGTLASLTPANPIPIEQSIELGASGLTVGDGTFSSSRNISGSGQLTKTGSHPLILNVANSYTGGTLLDGGTVYIGNDQALGTGPLRVSGNAALQTLSDRNPSNAVLLNAGSVLDNNGGGALTLSGPITGAGSLQKSGLQNLTLTGNVSATGGISIERGTLFVTGAGRLSGTAPVSLTGPTALLDLSQATAAPTLYNLSGISGASVRAGTHPLTLTSTTNTTFGGTIATTGDVIKVGAGTLTLSGAQSYTGGTVIRAGTLALTGAGALPAAQPITLEAASVLLDISGANDAKEFGALSGVADSALRLGANNLIVNQTASTTFAGASNGTGALVKRGTGTLTLQGSNSIGGLTVEAGTVALAGSGLLASTTVVALNDASSTLDISGATGVRLFNGLSGVSGSRLVLGANAVLFGGITPQTFSGVISGTGLVTTTGQVRLAGANEHTGGTSVGGTLTAGANNVLGAGLFSVGAGGTFDLNGTTQTVASLSGSGIIRNSGLLTFGGDNLSTTFAGTIVGAGDLVKTGSGTFTLSGNSIDHTGRIRVAGGELNVTGSTTGAVRMQAGSQLTGTGDVGSAVVDAGATMHIGASTGVSVMNDLTLASGSTLAYTLGSNPTVLRPDLGNAYSVVGGDLTLNGNFDLLNPANYTGVGYYRVLRYDGARTGTLQIGNVPTGLSGPVSLVYDVPNAVDLRIGAAGSETLQQWAGGTTWDGVSTNWLNDGGTIPIDWRGNHAAFTTPGGGTIAVAGTQSFAGLQFVTSGYTLNGAGTLETKSAGSEIRVLGGESATIGTVISGVGGIDKTEAGTLTLTGTNTYAGKTVLSGGTLSVTRDASLGDPSAALRFQGGTLEISGNTFNDTARGIEWTAAGGGLNIVDAANTFTITQTLNGTGSLVKSGPGTLRLSGTQAYGDTVVTAGTLIGDADSIRGNVANASALVFEQATPGTFAGNIASTGTLQKTGGSILALTGTSSGNWDLTQGTLAVDAANFQGDARIDAVAGLRFVQPAAATYAGQISGAGSLTKMGTGVLTLAGDSSAFTGATQVQAGSLIVGTAGGNGRLGGPVTVASGATLGGSGTVGTTYLSNGARIAPGNGIGTLTIAGDLTFSPTSIYEVEADPASNNSDRIDVSGHTVIDGSVLHVGADGGFGTARIYTILTSGTLDGTFRSVSSNFAYLDPTLTYGTQRVTLSLERKEVPVDPVTPVDPVNPVTPPAPTPTRPIAFSDLAQSGNQRAVARALETLPASNALHEFVLTLQDGQPPAVFDSLSGEAHAGVTGSLSQSAAQPRALTFNKLRANLDAGLRPGAPTAAAGMSDAAPSASTLPSSNAQPAWAEIFGNWRTQDGNGNTAGTREHMGGVFVGADHAVGGGWRAGAALGYADSRIDTRDRASRADVSSYTALLYGGRSFDAGPGAWKLMLGAGYTWHDISTERTALSQAVKLEADYGASTTQLFTELGYRWDATARATLEPFVGVAWSDLRTRSFTESGGAAALSGRSTSTTQTMTTLGLRGTQEVDVGTLAGQLRATAGWRHLFGDVTPTSLLAFEGSQVFTVAGAPIARDAAVLELGADLAVGRATTLGVSYTGQLAKDSREHGAQVNVRWRF
ncbi:autotransporter domain-containing protein [Achromobacter animicus]|uniref:autotransporter domain-containing protein n=1 Tax=Achromobacter animicus TaxID=1389935 RepID=UPI0028AA9DDB|nr:autotransporter domain-containing protein [Achromobacter animicus]